LEAGWVCVGGVGAGANPPGGGGGVVL